MAEVASAFVSLLPFAKGFGAATEKQVGGEMNRSGKKVGARFGMAMKVGIGAAIGGGAAALGFLKSSLGEAREAQKVTAQTNAVIKATGGAAKVTAKQVGDLASSISLKSGIDDEVIQSGANMLLTFKNIRNETGKGNDIFNQSTRVLTDMATAMGSEPKQAAIQLGKALNDPIKGVASLGRVGVQFTDQQKEQIKTLVESGDVMGAQKIVLKELNSEFKGSAEAQATAGDKAKVAWGNLQEAVGTAVLPLWDKILAGGTKAMTFLGNNIEPAVAKIGDVFGSVKDAVTDVFASFGSGSGGGFMDWIRSTIAMLRSNFMPVLQSAADTFKTVVLPAIQQLSAYLASKLLPVFSRVWGIIKTQVMPIMASLAVFVYRTLYPAVAQIVTVIAAKLKPVFDQVVATIQGRVLPTAQDLLAKFREWQPTIQRVTVVVVKIIGKVLEFAAAIVGKLLPVAIRLGGWLISKLVPNIATVIGWIVKIIGKVISFGAAMGRAVVKVTQFVGDVRGKFNDMLTFIKSVPGKILALGGKFKDAGKSIIGKLIEGLKNAGGFISGIAGSIWNAVKGMLNAAIDKINSSLEFTVPIPGAPDIHINPKNIPHLAKGGNVRRGRQYLVGEEGPELFTAEQSGRITPNHKLHSALRSELGQQEGNVFNITTSDPSAAAREAARLFAFA